MIFQIGENTEKNLRTLEQSGRPASMRLVQAVIDFIHYTPIDFCVIENGGYRTEEMQNSLFKKGVSKCDGYKKKSFHQSGLAVDLVPWVNGNPTWDEKCCFFLSGAFMTYCKERRLPITSGSDWDGDGNLKEKDSWDPCHFQIKE